MSQSPLEKAQVEYAEKRTISEQADAEVKGLEIAMRNAQENAETAHRNMRRAERNLLETAASRN